MIHINITRWTTLHLSTLVISLITSCFHLSIPKSFICPHKNRNSSISFTPTNTAILSIPSQPRLQGLTKERSISYNPQGKCDLCQPQGCYIHLLVFRWHEAMNTWQHSHSLDSSQSIVYHLEVLLFVMDQKLDYRHILPLISYEHGHTTPLMPMRSHWTLFDTALFQMNACINHGFCISYNCKLLWYCWYQHLYQQNGEYDNIELVFNVLDGCIRIIFSAGKSCALHRDFYKKKYWYFFLICFYVCDFFYDYSPNIW